jgi:hypothetical protein
MRYKQSPLLITLVLLGVLFTFSQGFKEVTPVSVNKTEGPGFAVIELFTSEGCSSCPSSDIVVADFLKANTEKVFVLAFHVDYWNKLGWKDVFSKAAYTARQSQYASVFGLQSIYTPQIVVNGRHEFVGSNGSQLKRVVEKELTSGMGKPLNLTVTAAANNHIQVNYQLIEKTNAKMNIALVQLHVSSDIKRGENEGRHLDHVNVVRDFKVLNTEGLTGSADIEIPAGLAKSDCKIIAYLQNPVSMEVSGVAEAVIQ